jgi:hypothetical protein
MWTTKLLKLASLSLASMACEIANGQQPAMPPGAGLGRPIEGAAGGLYLPTEGDRLHSRI